MSDPDWPFDQAQNCATFTLRSIIFDGHPILHVSHDIDDHSWQFLDDKPVDMANAALVALSTIVKHDSSVLEIADLPPGWIAIRDSVRSPWRRVPREDA